MNYESFITHAAAVLRSNPLTAVQLSILQSALAECAKPTLGKHEAHRLVAAILHEAGAPEPDYNGESTPHDAAIVRHMLALMRVDLLNETIPELAHARH
jgi:hypothetical protein